MHVKIHMRLWLLVGIGAMAVVSIPFEHHTAREPAYQGMAISHWLNQLPSPMVRTVATGSKVTNIVYRRYDPGPRTIQTRESLAAVRCIGSNGIPFILARLKQRESCIKSSVRNLALSLGLGAFTPTDPRIDRERGQAVVALSAFGSLPPETIEQLEELSRSKNRMVASAARAALSSTDHIVVAQSLSRSHQRSTARSKVVVIGTAQMGALPDIRGGGSGYIDEEAEFGIIDQIIQDRRTWIDFTTER